MDDLLGCQLVELEAHGSERGRLTVVVDGEDPFVPARVVVLADVPLGAHRGGHAHRRARQLLVPLRGVVKITVGDGHRQAAIVLGADPRLALLVPALRWVELSDFSAEAAVLLLGSEAYDPAEFVASLAELADLEAAS